VGYAPELWVFLGSTEEFLHALQRGISVSREKRLASGRGVNHVWCPGEKTILTTVPEGGGEGGALVGNNYF